MASPPKNQPDSQAAHPAKGQATPHPTSQRPAKVYGLTVTGVRGIKLMDITPPPSGVVPLRGRNGAGKSSALDALWGALGGALAIKGEDIRADKDFAEVSVDLGKYVVTRRITRDDTAPNGRRTKLFLTTPDGQEVKAPQRALSELLGGTPIDPGWLLNMTPEERAYTLANAATETIDFDELRRAETEAEQDVKQAEALHNLSHQTLIMERCRSFANLSDALVRLIEPVFLVGPPTAYKLPAYFQAVLDCLSDIAEKIVEREREDGKQDDPGSFSCLTPVNQAAALLRFEHGQAYFNAQPAPRLPSGEPDPFEQAVFAQLAPSAKPIYSILLQIIRKADQFHDKARTEIGSESEHLIALASALLLDIQSVANAASIHIDAAHLDSAKRAAAQEEARKAHNATVDEIERLLLDMVIKESGMTDALADVERAEERVAFQEQQLLNAQSLLRESKLRLEQNAAAAAAARERHTKANEDYERTGKVLDAEQESVNLKAREDLAVMRNIIRAIELDVARYTNADASLRESIGSFNNTKLAIRGARQELSYAQLTRQEKLESMTYPIDGVRTDGREVYINGIPFPQASTGERLRVGAAIAISSAPALKVMRIADGSLLDEHSLAELDKIAKATGFQVWVELVDDEPSNGYWVEEGTFTWTGDVSQ